MSEYIPLHNVRSRGLHGGRWVLMVWVETPGGVDVERRVVLDYDAVDGDWTGRWCVDPDAIEALEAELGGRIRRAEHTVDPGQLSLFAEMAV
jgi:hypothetical protein